MTRSVPVVAAVVAVVALTGPIRAENAPRDGVEIQRGLLRAAPTVVQYLVDHNASTVGVLRFFLTQEGSKEKLTAAAGPINYRLAEDTEKALLFALARHENARGTAPRLIRNASKQVAQKAPDASVFDAEKRSRLFAPDYDMAWGKPARAKAEMFLIGFVHLSANRKSMDVSLYALDSKAGAPAKVTSFQSPTSPADLIDTGFTLRAISDSIVLGNVSVGDVETGARVDTTTNIVSKPLDGTDLQDAPIQLEILYDGVPRPVQFHSGNYLVEEPKDGQTVSFRLSRKDASAASYAVVLKVNGRNSIEEQTLSAPQCRKWVLDAGDAPVTVDGFYHPPEFPGGRHRVLPFRVLSDQESQARELEFGPEVGQISLTIFKEGQGSVPTTPPATTNRAEDTRVASIRGAKLPDEPSDTAVAARDRFEKMFTRGLIDKGTAATEADVRTVTRDRLGLERSITIIYRASLPPQ